MGAIAILAAPLYAILAPFMLVSNAFGSAYGTLAEIFGLWANFFG